MVQCTKTQRSVYALSEHKVTFHTTKTISTKPIAFDLPLPSKHQASTLSPTIMKFTDADFLTASPSPPPLSPLRIKILSYNLRLPVAPPSPLFDGINEETNTHRFPAFQDALNIRKSVPTPEPHCTLHCSYKVCVRQMTKEFGSPICQCVSEEEESSVSWYRPVMELEELDLMCIADNTAKIDPAQEIDIHIEDATRVVAYLEPRAVTRAMDDGYLRRAMMADFGQDEEVTTRDAVHRFFYLVRVYFDRTLHSTGQRVISIEQLRCELDVYVWTLLDEWVTKYCDRETQRLVLENNGPMCILDATVGAPAAVLELWYECVEYVIGVLIWRDEEVRWRRLEGVIGFCVLLVIFFLFVNIVLWGGLVSHIRWR